MAKFSEASGERSKAVVTNDVPGLIRQHSNQPRSCTERFIVKCTNYS